MPNTDRYLSPILFSAEISNAETKKSYEFKTAREVAFKEDWLQNAIEKNPEIVLSHVVKPA